MVEVAKKHLSPHSSKKWHVGNTVEINREQGNQFPIRIFRNDENAEKLPGRT